jgi:hypothetical protein
MKNSHLSLGMSTLAALVATSFSAFAEDKAVDCARESATTTEAVVATPENVLKIVAERLAISPTCSCEIVKAAIIAAKADKTLVLEIVKAAVEAAPTELPNIIACASNAAPESTAAIANLFADATEGSGKGVVSSGKEVTGKGIAPAGPVMEDEFSDDFGLIRPGVGGIYFSTPGGGGFTVVDDGGGNNDGDDTGDDDDGGGVPSTPVTVVVFVPAAPVPSVK